MTDKDVEGVLAALEPHLAHVVCTQNSTHRAMPAAELAVVAREVFGPDRVIGGAAAGRRHRRGARRSPRPARRSVSSIGTGAVLVTGSVVTVGEARTMLRRAGQPVVSDERGAVAQARMCAAILSLEAVVLGLTTPVMINLARRAVADGVRGRARALRRLSGAGRPAALGGGVRRRAG